MDNVERSQLQQQQILAAALSHPHRQAKTIAYTGYCLNEMCEQPLAAPLRWCNAQCRKSWEEDQRYAG